MNDDEDHFAIMGTVGLGLMLAVVALVGSPDSEFSLVLVLLALLGLASVRQGWAWLLAFLALAAALLIALRFRPVAQTSVALLPMIQRMRS